MPMYRKVNKNFFKKWTHEMAYVLGFFAADGYITVNRRGGQFWCIQITDKALLENIKKSTCSEHKIGAIKRVKRFGDNLTKTYRIYRLQIGSIGMCNDLRHLGMRERKTKSLSAPNVPGKYFSDFVRGYFDGDGGVWTGYVHKERVTKLKVIRVVFTSCSMDFLEALKQKLATFGVENGVVRKEKGNYYRLVYSVHGSLKLYDFMYNHGVSMSKGLFLERKRRVFEKYNTFKNFKNAAVAQR